MKMKLWEIKTSCGATIQAGKLTEPEKSLGIVYCPVECPFCGKQHGLEASRSIQKIEVSS